MRDRATSGPFKTTGTEQWPIRMCQSIAAMLLDTCSATATTANEGQDLTSKWRITEIATQSASQKAIGYRVEKGHPDRARHSGYKDFHDGGGLCLPGRWRKEVRELADGANWYWLRREMKKAILEFVGLEKELEPSGWPLDKKPTGEWLGMSHCKPSYWRYFAHG